MHGDIRKKRKIAPPKIDLTRADTASKSGAGVSVSVEDEMRRKPEVEIEKKDLESSFHVPFHEELEKLPEIDQEEKKAPSVRKTKPKLQIKISNHSYFGTLLIIFLALTVLFIFSSMKSLAQIEGESDQLKTNYDTFKQSISRNDFAKLASSFNDIGKNASSLQLNLQRAGQDIKYYSFLPGAKSGIAEQEIILGITTDLMDSIKSSSAEFSSNMKVCFGDKDYVIDLSVLGNFISSRSEDLQKKLNYDYVKLGYVRSPEAATLRDQLASVTDHIKAVNQFLQKDFQSMIGQDGSDKNYLVIFQNNSELRGASGGSFGSFGVAKFSSGKLTGIDFGQNIYKLDNPFRAKNQITPPEGLDMIVDTYSLRDSGWSTDGPTAFSNITDFYKKETGKSVDGTISIDVNLVEALLSQVGPVTIPEYNLSVNSQNFRETFDKETHEAYYDSPNNVAENEPKKIIGNTIPIMIDKIKDIVKGGGDRVGLLNVVYKASQEKHLLLYFKNISSQKEVEKANLAGKLNATTGDFLAIINSNVGGGKSSQLIEENVNLKVNISDDGQVSNQLSLERDYSDPGYRGDTNVNFVRMAVQAQAKVLGFTPTAGNFQQFMKNGYKNNQPYWTTSESNKQIIDFWMSTKPQEKSTASISYSGNDINLADEFDYKILLQRQPGAPADNYALEVNYPESYHPQNVTNYLQSQHSIRLNFSMDKDRLIKIHFVKN